MESQKALEDIAVIKTMMHRSSRFLSLSGLSGVLAGIYALIGAYLGHNVLIEEGLTAYGQRSSSLSGLINLYLDHPAGSKLVLIGLAVLVAAILTGALLTIRKARKQGEKVWDVSSRKLLFSFTLPLVTGGIFCLVLLQYGIIGLVAPCTLIFYGLALVNASKFTLGDIKYLGLVNIIIGLINTQYIGYGLYFWALGFGLLHIFYGALMYFKYDREKK